MELLVFVIWRLLGLNLCVLARFSISVFLASFSPLAHESSAAISDLRAAFSESSFPSSFAMSVMRACGTADKD